MPKLLDPSIRNRGFSTGETIIAISLLAILVGVVGKFANDAREGVENLRFQKLLQWELQNTRERIGSWPVERITQENIAAIEISAEITEQLSEARWHAIISPTTIHSLSSTSSTPALSIQLRLTGRYKGQQILPTNFQFWILTESTEPQSATQQSEAEEQQPETNLGPGEKKIEATR